MSEVREWSFEEVEALKKQGRFFLGEDGELWYPESARILDSSLFPKTGRLLALEEIVNPYAIRVHYLRSKPGFWEVLGDERSFLVPKHPCPVFEVGTYYDVELTLHSTGSKCTVSGNPWFYDLRVFPDPNEDLFQELRNQILFEVELDAILNPPDPSQGVVLIPNT